MSHLCIGIIWIIQIDEEKTNKNECVYVCETTSTYGSDIIIIIIISVLSDHITCDTVIIVLLLYSENRAQMNAKLNENEQRNADVAFVFIRWRCNTCLYIYGAHDGLLRIE